MFMLHAFTHRKGHCEHWGTVVSTSSMQVTPENAGAVADLLYFSHINGILLLSAWTAAFFHIDPWICKCPRTMPPPKPPVKGTSSPTSVGTPTPGTPLSSPGTPHPDAETSEPAKTKPRKTAQEQVPLTPLQKARDMCQKLLKKKSDASNLGLTLQSIPFAGALSTEMNN